MLEIPACKHSSQYPIVIGHDNAKDALLYKMSVCRDCRKYIDTLGNLQMYEADVSEKLDKEWKWNEDYLPEGKMLKPGPEQTLFVYHTASLGEPNRYVTFFNESECLMSQFSPRTDRERNSNYFWFHDSYYSHSWIVNQRRFLHLFVRNPEKDKINFWFHRDNSWEELCKHYLENKKPLAESYQGNGTNPLFFNPPILRTDDILVPDLIFEFPTAGANEATIIYPAEHTGISCKLFTDEHVPIPFNQIPEIVYLLPQIKEALPFIL